ncbi:MAG: UvrD-helicase domain-containing protein [Synergistaceae bacterium]|nr:UvrD-helicase domain-containing protein [Synergistaceae bacterium]
MTLEEQQQVQNLINAKTRLLTQQINSQQNHIYSLTEEISARNDEINSLNRKIIALNDEIIDKREEIESLNSKIDSLHGKINALNTEIDSKKREISSLQTQLNDSHAENQKLTAYIQSTPPPEEIKSEPEIKPEPVQAVKPVNNYLVSLLRQHFGFDSFKPGQEEIINALLSGRDVFCSMPDNYGKSICYRLPALLMPGLTLVIADENENFNIDSHSARLDNSLNSTQKRELLRRIKSGACKILYSDLEQLNGIINFLNGVEISLIAVIMRENLIAYREFADSLNSKRIPIAIFTGVTSPEQRAEIMKDLRSPMRVITGFELQNYSFAIIKSENKNASINEILTQHKDSNGIIYTSKPQDFIKFAGRNALILSQLSQEDASNANFIVYSDFAGTLAEFFKSAIPDKDLIILVSQKDLRTSDGAFIMFCNSDDPIKILAGYIGTEESQVKPDEEISQPIELTPEDFADFDFTSANESQKEAITTTNGPLLILAGPGTGKTFTLIQRTIFLIQKKRLKPENILIATFTNRAAHEILSRMSEEFKARNIQADINELYIGTFHSLCEKILRGYVQFTRFKKNFRILDDFEHKYLLMRKIERFNDITALTSPGKWDRAEELCNYINKLSEELADSQELIRDSDPLISSLGRAMLLHDDLLIDDNSLSFSALLVETYKLLRDNPEILESLQSRIKYLMADEYQDTNYIQEQILFLIAGESKNICVAGDDDQSLYRFRGAAVRNILEFPEKFARNECKIVKLLLNYRSDANIMKFFTSWINDTGKFFNWENFRYDKNLEAFRNESKSVFRLAGVNDSAEWHEKILALLKSLTDSGKLSDYNQVAFLFRSVRAAHVQELAQFLENHNIKVYSPRSDMFFKRGEIHFALGCFISMFPKYLKSLESGEFKFNGHEPENIIYYRNCLRTVARFIDKPGYLQLKKWLMKKRDFHAKLNGYANYSYSDLLYNLFAFMPFNKALDAEINSDVKTLRPARNLSRLMQVIKDFEHISNINNIHSKYIESQTIRLFNIYLRFLLEGGLNEYESEDPAAPSGHVAFMTIHQAKGREFPVVLVDSLSNTPNIVFNDGTNSEIMNAVESKYFKRPPFEPEDMINYFDFWRLYYVAFSRAKDLLILTCREDSTTPSKYFEDSYNSLDDADESFNPENINISESNNSSLKQIYSFTSDILLYESCPVKYKFYRELEFSPVKSKTQLIGILVHSVIDDINKAVINGQENLINEQIISNWLESDYTELAKTERAALTKADREIALGHVIRYVILRGNDWSGIKESESELKLIRDDYIITGRADLICSDNGQIDIIEFKTGTKPNININHDRARLETHKRQLNIYAYIFSQTTGQKVNRLRLYYMFDGSTSPEIVYDYNESEAQEFINGFDEIVQEIRNKDFSRRTDNHETCRECEFRFYCGREESIENILAQAMKE